MEVEIQNVPEYDGIHISVEDDGSVTVQCNTEKWIINQKDLEDNLLHIYKKDVVR